MGPEFHSAKVIFDNSIITLNFFCDDYPPPTDWVYAIVPHLAEDSIEFLGWMTDEGRISGYERRNNQPLKVKITPAYREELIDEAERA